MTNSNTNRIKKRHYAKLRGLLREHGHRQDIICDILSRSNSYVDSRMAGKAPFTIEDGYAILDFYAIDERELVDYFPKGGVA